MTAEPNSTNDSNDSTTTLAEHLFRLPTLELRKELEGYLQRWEARHGPVDLTKYYTSMWPRNDQVALMAHHPKRYFDGLPEFVQDYMRHKMESYALEGNLDDAPQTYQTLFVQGLMRRNEDSRGR